MNNPEPSSSAPAAFSAFARSLWEHVGARLGFTLGLVVVVGLLEGSGLLLMLPLFDSIGLGQGQASKGTTETVSSVLRGARVPLTLPALLTAFVLVMTLQSFLRASLEILNARIESSFTCSLRERLSQALARADWLFFTRHRSSDITQVLIEELQRTGLGAQQLLSLLGIGALALVQTVIAFRLSPLLAGLALVCGGVVAFVLRPLRREAHDLGKISQKKRKELAAAITEHLSGMKIAKSHGLEAHHVQLLNRISREIMTHWLRAIRIFATSRGCFEVGAMLALSVFLYCAVVVVHLPATELALLVFIFMRLLPRMVAIQGAWQRITQALPSFEAAESLRRQLADAAEPAGSGTIEPLALRCAIHFENVEFRYDPNRETAALHGIDLTIPARQVTAICGPSGAGKSTLADLLLGLLQPSSGRILLDAVPLNGPRLHAWRQSIGYVPQETFLFHDTVRANLLWASPQATELDLQAALRSAAAEEFVRKLPQGLDTVLGDRGVRLSGGERQRLALARALLRKPTVLVLDEATSSLDTQNERLIQKAIENLHGELTIVLIAHRLSTVRIADQIVVLQSGRIAEMGAWGSLSQREGGVFQQLVAAG